VRSGVWLSWLAHPDHRSGGSSVQVGKIAKKFFRGVAQLASALAWGARGRLFESDHPDRVCEDPKKSGVQFCVQSKDKIQTVHFSILTNFSLISVTRFLLKFGDNHLYDL
jgi:hypothetical protein